MDKKQSVSKISGNIVIAGNKEFKLLPSAKIKEGDLYLDRYLGNGDICRWESEDWSLDLTNKKEYTKVREI